jgi:hypothetical protein
MKISSHTNFLKKQLPLLLLLFNNSFADELKRSSTGINPRENLGLSDMSTFSDSLASEPEASPSLGESSEEPSPSSSSFSTTPSAKYSPSQGCHSPFHRMHVSVRHNEGRGVGYRDGYTTLEGFGIYDGYMGFMPFLDLRGHAFNDGKFAGNAGIGARSLLTSINHLLGYYIYYDVRQDRRHLTPQQISPGIELIGKRMEYRINGYFPVGDRKSHKYDFQFDSFKGHRIILKDKQRYAMSGGDAEVGMHLTQMTSGDVYAGVGPYYFSSPHAHSWGGKARLLGRFKEYFSLEFSYTYDHLFRSIFQGYAAITLPFGKKLSGKQCTPKNDLVLSRAAFSPYRFEIPVVKKVRTKEKAINPATGEPWNVWFVNNTSSSNGTFESPFPMLLQAQNASAPNDIIYVFAGDGTPNGMNQGIVLQNAQKLFGSGIAQFINTTRGGITIPAFTSNLPAIENPISTVIVLSNENEVSGVQLQNTGDYFILGSNIQGGMIHDNLISGIGTQGIFISGNGNFLIANNQMNYSGNDAIFMHANNLMNCTISNNVINVPITAFEGIRIDTSTGATCNGIISDNTISEVAYGIRLNSSGLINATITNNTLINTMASAIYGQGPNLLVNIANNRIINSVQGILFFQIQSSCLAIVNNQVSNVIANGIAIAPIGSPTNAFINNNTVNGVASGFYGINANTSAPLCLQLYDNTVTNGAGYLLENNSTTFELDAANNIGSVTEVGTITTVSSGTCNTCIP